MLEKAKTLSQGPWFGARTWNELSLSSWRITTLEHSLQCITKAAATSRVQETLVRSLTNTRLCQAVTQGRYLLSSKWVNEFIVLKQTFFQKKFSMLVSDGQHMPQIFQLESHIYCVVWAQLFTLVEWGNDAVCGKMYFLSFDSFKSLHAWILRHFKNGGSEMLHWVHLFQK